MQTQSPIEQIQKYSYLRTIIEESNENMEEIVIRLEPTKSTFTNIQFGHRTVKSK